MSILENVKASQLAARKARLQDNAASLTTLIGEAEAVGKNAGNRAPTDAEVVAVIKKFVKNVEESLRAATERKMDEKITQLEQERALYNSFLPKQMSEQELASAVSSIVSEVGSNIGVVMKTLKERFDGTYDGTMASKIVKAAIVK